MKIPLVSKALQKIMRFLHLRKIITLPHKNLATSVQMKRKLNNFSFYAQ